MNQLEELQKTLFTIYNKNITYLKNNFPKLYKKIEEFEKLNIETEYIDFKDAGFFEITNINTQKGTYNCNSFYDAEYRANKIKDSKAIFSMLVEKIDSKNYNEEDEISAHIFVEEFLNSNNHTLSKKLIFIGTLLGIHINDIHKTNPHEVYLIIEPSIERFRLSLFFADYESISKTSKLFFSIQENDLELKRSLLEFLEYKFSLNHFIKFELASEKEIYLIDKLKNTIISANPFINAFSEDILAFKRSLKNIKNSNGFIKINNLTLFDEKPLLVLGAGPSLEKYQDFIKKFENKFIIISVSAALKRLEKIEVIPDIVINIDKKNFPILEQFNVDEKYYKNSIVLLGPKTNSTIFNKVGKEKTFIVQENIEVFKKFQTIDCVSAGDFATKLAIELGAKSLYILGIDAAFSNNKTHDSLHLSSKNELTDNAYEKDIFEIEGNFQKKVKTNLHHEQIVESFKKISINTNTKIFNLSDGAKLDNTIALKPEDININDFIDINKKDISKNIFNILKEKAINIISSLDKKEFQKELKILKKIDIKLEEKNAITLLKKYPSSKSLNIIYRYFKLIKPYSKDENISKQYNLLIEELKKIFTV